ncbi:TetR/AcrR family transcriptional regulator [Nisaea acidiphila]|uniref:TetR/AcrR family transcriptional regulator n=1 Tax=Nisaea acidiphila TaxID=1862145 RepID=A0A9J7AYX5_9PROT|nr:TetR/AcrR family transcriptional regulator [Nisaea acidiphila]UUX51468.1 TetR/AcrR family transcriptional regulator [Nisaea acidiphila]
MARQKEFDRAEVLENAMRAFWRRGYEATSVQDLVEATGINRGSMYDTFGDKRGLFQAAVQHYITNVSAERLKVVAETDDALAGIRTYFDRLIDFSVGDGRELGCLITNSVVELAPHDEVIGETLRKSFARVEDTFYRALLRAQQAGDLTTGQDIRALARFLTATVNGVRVFARADADATTLRDVIDSALSVIDTHKRGFPAAAE